MKCMKFIGKPGRCVVALAAMIFGWFVCLALSAEAVKFAPGNALVVVDARTKTYSPPLCQTFPVMPVMTITEARANGFKANPDALDRGEFDQPGRGVIGMFLECIRVLPKERSRWNADGTWNW